MDHVILVDANNRAIGMCEKTEAHTGEGQLHRAFSVYVFRKMGKEILIQKRSAKKMLWPGIWANTCCSHPRKGEAPADAGKRRLREELGFSCEIKPVCSFMYRAVDPENRGTEHEFVTVLLGLTDDNTVPVGNPDEVAEWKWVSVEELRKDMKRDAGSFAPWFHLGMNAIKESIPN